MVLLTGAPPANGAVLYGIEINNDNLFTIDTVTGTTNVVGALGVDWVFGGLAFDDVSGNLFGTTGSSLYSVNAVTGAATLIGATGIATLENLAILGGTGYGHNVVSDDFYSINLASGASTLLGSSATTNIASLATDGTDLFAADILNNDLVKIDKNNGAVTVVGPYAGLTSSPTSLAFAASSLWTIPALSNNLYSLNPATGASSLVHSGLGLGHVSALAGPALAQVPEPTTLALFGLALAGLGFARRRVH